MSHAFHHQPGRAAVIRNITTGLCLDAAGEDVTIEYFTGAPAQLWILEPVGGSKYVIRNSGNGDVLDIEGGADSGAPLITYEAHGGVNQQWYINHDHTISSAAGNLAIDINEGKCFPGQFLIAYDRHGRHNQQFAVQYQ